MRISFGKTRSARSLVAQGRFFFAVGLCQLNTLILKRNALALKGSNLGQILVIRKIGIFKFVDLNAFYERLGLPKDAKIYIEKCRFFSPTPFERRIKLTPTLCLGYY